MIDKIFRFAPWVATAVLVTILGFAWGLANKRAGERDTARADEQACRRALADQTLATRAAADAADFAKAQGLEDDRRCRAALDAKAREVESVRGILQSCRTADTAVERFRRLRDLYPTSRPVSP